MDLPDELLRRVVPYHTWGTPGPSAPPAAEATDLSARA